MSSRAANNLASGKIPRWRSLQKNKARILWIPLQAKVESKFLKSKLNRLSLNVWFAVTLQHFIVRAPQHMPTAVRTISWITGSQGIGRIIRQRTTQIMRLRLKRRRKLSQRRRHKIKMWSLQRKTTICNNLRNERSLRSQTRRIRRFT